MFVSPTSFQSNDSLIPVDGDNELPKKEQAAVGFPSLVFVVLCAKGEPDPKLVS